MQAPRVSNVMASLVLSAQLMGVGFAEAADGPHGPANSRSRMIVSGLRGEVQVLPAAPVTEARRVRFHDHLTDGDQIITGPGSLTEVLMGQADVSHHH